MKAWIMELCPEIAEWQADLIAEECEKRVKAALTQGEPDDAPVAMRFPHTSDWDKVTCPHCNATFNVEAK